MVDRVRRRFIPLVARTSDNPLSTNQHSAVSLAPAFRYRTTVLGTPMEGSKKSGTFTMVETTVGVRFQG